ncbi:glycoside hydrolase family 127 protein [Clostridium sp.]
MNKHKKFDFVKLKNSKIQGGFWGHRTENYMEIINSMLEALLCETNSVRLVNFGIAAGEIEGEFFGSYWSDGDCYKFIEGCCEVYQNTGDEKVKAIIDTYVPWMIKSQESDGYINTQITLTDKGRWTKYMHHELYNMGHFFTMAVAHYEVTGEKTLFECAKKLGDYLYGVFASYPKGLAHFGFNPSQIMGLCELYDATGEKTYYQLAEVFVNMRGSAEGGTDQNQDRVPLRKETMAIGHAVTSTYLYAGATDVYAQTGEKELMDALERIWKDLTSKRIYITGGVCPDFVGYSERGDLTHESHGTQYELPNKIAYNESCANIGAAMWMMRMLAVTGDTKYGDWVEQIMCNAGISGSNLGLTRYFYSNPLAYRKETPISQEFAQYKHKSSRRWHTFTCWCCPPQLFRTMAGIGKWVYGEAKDTVYVNLFANCDYTGDNGEISMRTNYPWEGNINITIKKAENLTLKIRIPAWCKTPTVNGKAVEGCKYFEVVVNSGDEISVDLPMKVMLMQANANVEADRGMLCVKRGPVVYCAEGCDNDSKLDDIYIEPNAEFVCNYDSKLLDGVVKISAKASCVKQKDQLYYELLTDKQETTLNLIPYYAWANREESDMSIWFPKA